MTKLNLFTEFKKYIHLLTRVCLKYGIIVKEKCPFVHLTPAFNYGMEIFSNVLMMFFL